MKDTINLNQEVTIHLTDKGFIRLKEIIKEQMFFNTDKEVDDYVSKRKVGTDGYKDQLYSLMHLVGPMMFNGSPYLVTTVCEIGKLP